MLDDIIDQKEDRLSIKFIAEVVRSREKIPYQQEEITPLESEIPVENNELS